MLKLEGILDHQYLILNEAFDLNTETSHMMAIFSPGGMILKGPNARILVEKMLQKNC